MKVQAASGWISTRAGIFTSEGVLPQGYLGENSEGLGALGLKRGAPSRGDTRWPHRQHHAHDEQALRLAALRRLDAPPGHELVGVLSTIYS